MVAVNIDTRNPDKPRKSWLHDKGIGHLAYYSDPNAKVFQELKTVGKAIGMPTTLLIDPNGCEIASLVGPGRMGERRCGESHQCGAAAVGGRCFIGCRGSAQCLR